jgi:hypothetical protein
MSFVPPRRMWFQDIKETLKMSIDEVGTLARGRDSFRPDVMRAILGCTIVKIALFMLH